LPYTSVTVRGVALLCFPPDDAAFATVARRMFETSTSDTPAALERQLRTAYPRAVVRSREALASFGGAAWYVYRDGRYSPFGRGSRWWEDPAAARITLDDDGGYIDANPAALELLGVDRETFRASRSGDFTVPGYGVAIPWILQLLRDTGELHSTAVLRSRGDRPAEPIEFHLVKDADGPGRHVSTIRRVPLESAESAAQADAAD
jgi:PAS domain-containing protein